LEVAQNLLDVLDDETIAQKVSLDLSVVKNIRQKSQGLSQM